MDLQEVAALVRETKPTSKETATDDTEEQVTTAEEVEATDEESAGTEDLEEEQPDVEDDLDEEEPDDTEADEEVDTYRFKVEGEEVEATVDELIKSYQIEKAAKNRLREATEARNRAAEEGRQEGLKQAQTELQSQRREIETARQHLNDFAGFLGQNFVPTIQEPDPSLEETDPVRYNNEWIKYQRAMQDLTNQKSQMAAFVQQAEAARAQAEERARKENQAQLIAKRPDLREKEAQKTFTSNVRRAQEFAGFTSEEVNNFPDYRGVIALDKLGALLAQVDGPTPAQKVVAKAKKPIEPGPVKYQKSRRQKQQRADRDRAAQTGDYRDVAKLLIQDAPPKR